MSFTYSVIGDNTRENREHLEKLGYTPLRFYLNGKYLYARSCTWANKNCTWQEPYFATDNNIDNSPKNINCIGNDALFQAVTAMRSDSDYMQWFTCKVKDGLGNQLPDSWVLCTQKTLQDFGWVNNSPNSYGKNTPYHKATLAELQEHFK